MEDIKKILRKMGIDEPIEVKPFMHEEDENSYSVWLIKSGAGTYVLKKSSQRELSVYRELLMPLQIAAPRLYGSVNIDNEIYILIEYIAGTDLRKCDSGALKAALDTLIYLQDSYWERREHESAGISFENGLAGRLERGKYLNDPELERAYAEYLRAYASVPRTLCHDDLLPFNIIVSNERTGMKAYLIDWEYAGIMPYPTSLARLIAHAEDDKEALFYMTENVKNYAIEYYYSNFIRAKGISWADYIKTLELFMLYEYCEWIMLGNKYEDAPHDRFDKYLKKARELVTKMKNEK